MQKDSVYLRGFEMLRGNHLSIHLIWDDMRKFLFKKKLGGSRYL